MLRIIALATVLLCTAAFSGCERKYRPDPLATIEDPGELKTSIAMGDPLDSAQLLHGFYEAEGSSWRWSMRQFGVSLRPPGGAAQAGARLQMTFTIPEAAAEALAGLEIRATVSGVPLEPFRAAAGAGEQVYQALAPKEAVAGDAVTVEFELSRYLAPGTLDGRELGVVVSHIGFTEP
ncbi:MAG: hypothetical protein M9913_11990 [Bryobacteraceae bacterium]|nr:hypothetical protein [Solibacteraceae bacterium]MCO5351593.1 hypothetical protein [Bryobacteraceae bacterium]